MSERIDRQFALLRRMISDYQRGSLPLNSLIQRIEGVGEALEIESWRERAFPLVLAMEQVNAATIESKRALTAKEISLVEGSLEELERLIQAFQATRSQG